MTSSIPARITFVALALGTIALGLVVHYHGQAAWSAGRERGLRRCPAGAS